MEAQEFMKLFDSCWFEMEILRKRSCLSKSPGFDADPDHQIPEITQKPKVLKVPSVISRSMSDHIWPKTSFSPGFSLSPDSVLISPKLQTILSGKEITEEEGEISVMPLRTEGLRVQESPRRKPRSRIRGKKSLSKSLSELEFEEVKGFMDLGFVFSEEDKDSSLVSIIPGLQRLGKKDHEQEEEAKSSGFEESTVSRPYLSEAWEVLDTREKEEPLMNWKIPALSSEMDMKDTLKWWAHTVASTVR